jgi:phosphatidylserine/phosphatidylglycerophosphate/cardiolipin synthase-like enzyme
MKKQLFFLIIAGLAICGSLDAQVLSIAQVQGTGAITPYAGTSVTIKGAVTGVYTTGYFLRDSEAQRSGMYVYDTKYKPTLGDTIQVTATIVEYNEWTEMSIVTAYTRISTGNPAPEPVVVNASDLNENWENCLVTVKKAKCTKTTLGFGEWQINDGTGYAVVNDLGYPYTPQLDEKYTITGNLSFSFAFYKIEPRFAADVQVSNSVFINSEVYPSAIEKTSITLSWSTNIPGSTEVSWGSTASLESGSIFDTAKTVSHSVSIDGLSPASFYYIKAFTVAGADTTLSKAILYTTASESSGEIRVCFNQAGISERESDPPGIYTASMIDTMVAYVNLAQSTLDVTLYDFTNHASFSDTRNLALVNAINAAHNRGVAVRFLTDANVANEVLADLNPAIPILKVKTTAIMHDKFIIVDRESAANSWLVSGSTNPTYNNLVIDFNNLVAIQDQSVAKAYLLEFNEMFGSESGSPDTTKSLISLNKKDNTPHYFIVNGKRIELYFSPSDFTASHIVNTLKTAESSIDFSMMAFTEDVLGNALVDAKAKNIKLRGVIDYVEYSGSEYPKLVTAGVKVADYANPGGAGWPDAPTLHHKFAVVDAGTENAAVITGSHNWTAAADSKNDENTLIIHDAGISNLFKYESDRIYTWLKPMTCVNDTFNSLDESFVSIDVTSNDVLPSNYTMSIVSGPQSGIASILADHTITYESMLDCLCDIKDTLVYQICYPNDPDYCLQATVFINMNFTKPIICKNDTVSTVDENPLNFDILSNDNIPVEYNLSIIRQPEYGIATIESDKSITYLSTLCCNFYHITDTIVYKVCNQNGPLNCSEASVYLTLDFTTSIKETGTSGIRLWPNPVITELNIKSENQVSQIEIFDLTGKCLSVLSPLKSEFTVQMPDVKGVYFIRIKTSKGDKVMRKIFKI